MTLALSPQAIESQHFKTSPTSSLASASSIWSVASEISSRATSVGTTTSDTFPVPSTTIITQLSSQTVPGCDFRRTTTALAPARGPDGQDGVRPARPGLKIVPAEQRQHPRRTNRRVESNAPVPALAAQTCSATPPAPPATLQRQADRKVNFVENLVDSAAQIVETIWTPPKYLANSGKEGVLPLRTFIQETLRRSRTSYSTLQVALYYLIVIRPHLPKMECDTAGQSQEDIAVTRAKQCGRRMFLAALILASKYLQDRNYSARAWSKISGLPHQEINLNEMAFLHAIDWKLHISEMIFQKWTDLVLKYTSSPSPSPVSPTRTSPWNEEEDRKQEWCDLVKRLTPDLSEVELSSVAPAQLDTKNTSPAHIDLAPAHAHLPPPAALQKAHTMPAQTPNGPLPILEPKVQDSNAFNALHQHLSGKPILPIPVVSAMRRPSATNHSIPAVGSEISSMGSKKIGGAMAGVAQSAMSSMFAGCSQEAYKRVCPTPLRSAQTPCSLSSLSTCVSASEPSPMSGVITQSATNSMAAGSQGTYPRVALMPLQGAQTPRSLSSLTSRGSASGLNAMGQVSTRGSSSVLAGPSQEVYPRVAMTTQLRSAQTPQYTPIPSSPRPAFMRQDTSEMHKRATGHLGCTPETSFLLPTPTASPRTGPSLSMRRTSAQSYTSNQLAPMASPKSTEAAFTLNLLRDDHSPTMSVGSACTTPTAGRKRSCPSINSSNSSGVTPRLERLVGFRSPAIPQVCSPNLDRGGKRARCAWDRESFDTTMATQTVR